MGDFAIPKLDWNSEIKNSITSSNSIKKMATLMERNGFEDLITNLKNEIGNNLDTENISKKIRSEIKIYESKSKENILEIFHLIQLWGGISARIFYTKGSEINESLYKEFIDVIINTDNIHKIIEASQKFVKETKRVNVSFITKHINFWQKFSTNSKINLPIYDSVIALNVMGKYLKTSGSLIGYTYNDFKYLEIYWRNMLEVSKQINVPMNNIESHLFDFFRNSTPESWPRNFKINNI